MIWCVDDDNSIRDIETYALNSQGFAAKGFADGKEMFRALESETPRLIVLDIMLPGEDGIEILKKLRSNPKTAKIPVIMATAKGTETDKILGFNIGADDYLSKPFGVMEMVARVKAVLRRCENSTEEDTLVIGGITLREKKYKAEVNGEEISLTHKEFDILSLFMKTPDVVFTREQLMSNIWGVDFVGETRTVDAY